MEIQQKALITYFMNPGQIETHYNKIDFLGKDLLVTS